MTNHYLIFTGLILVILTMFIHEGIHLWTLRILGYNGKFVLVRKPVGMGIKPFGLRENIIGARDAIIFLLAPFPFTLVLFIICFILIGQNIPTILNISIGVFVSFLSCRLDIKQSREIWYWWMK